jgi:hypothetical protein
MQLVATIQPHPHTLRSLHAQLCFLAENKLAADMERTPNTNHKEMQDAARK